MNILFNLYCYEKLSSWPSEWQKKLINASQMKEKLQPENTFNQVSYSKDHRMFSLFQPCILEEFPNELSSQLVSPVKHL